MPIRFRRSMRLGPGVRLNLAKKSAGISFGGPGMRYSVNTAGRTWRSAGVPGTGLSHVSVSSGGKRGRDGSRSHTEAPPPSPKDIERVIPRAGFFSSGAEKAYRAGVVAFAQGKSEEAERKFAEAAERDEKHISDELFRAVALVRLGRNQDAIEPLERVVESTIALPDKWLRKYSRPLLLGLRVRIAPGVSVDAPFDSSGAALLLAQIYQEAGDIDDALDVLEGMGEAGFDEQVIALALADLHVEKEDWNQVLDLTEGIDNEDDATAALLAYRGLALLEQGLARGALDVLRAALRSRARNDEVLVQARYLRGRAYEELGQRKRALNDYERTLAIDHNHEDAAAGVERLRQ